MAGFVDAPTDDVVMSNWAFARDGELLILCMQGQSEPPEADFLRWLARLDQPDYTKLLCCPRGGDLSATQRRRLVAFWKERPDRVPPVAVITDSIAARAAVTAVEWFLNTGKVKALPTTELDGALAWLGAASSNACVAQVISRLHGALTTQLQAVKRTARAK